MGIAGEVGCLELDLELILLPLLLGAGILNKGSVGAPIGDGCAIGGGKAVAAFLADQNTEEAIAGTVHHSVVALAAVEHHIGRAERHILSDQCAAAAGILGFRCIAADGLGDLHGDGRLGSSSNGVCGVVAVACVAAGEGQHHGIAVGRQLGSCNTVTSDHSGHDRISALPGHINTAGGGIAVAVQDRYLIGDPLTFGVAAVADPLGVHGGMVGVDLVCGDLISAHRQVKPAVKDVAVHNGYRQFGQLIVGGDGSFLAVHIAAVGIEGHGVLDLLPLGIDGGVFLDHCAGSHLIAAGSCVKPAQEAPIRADGVRRQCSELAIDRFSRSFAGEGAAVGIKGHRINIIVLCKGQQGHDSGRRISAVLAGHGLHMDQDLITGHHIHFYCLSGVVLGRNSCLLAIVADHRDGVICRAAAALEGQCADGGGLQQVVMAVGIPCSQVGVDVLGSTEGQLGGIAAAAGRPAEVYSIAFILRTAVADHQHGGVFCAEGHGHHTAGISAVGGAAVDHIGMFVLNGERCSVDAVDLVGIVGVCLDGLGGKGCFLNDPCEGSAHRHIACGRCPHVGGIVSIHGQLDHIALADLDSLAAHQRIVVAPMDLAGNAGSKIGDAVQPLILGIYRNGQLTVTDGGPVIVIVGCAGFQGSGVLTQHQLCRIHGMTCGIDKLNIVFAVAHDGKIHGHTGIGGNNAHADNAVGGTQLQAVRKHLKIGTAGDVHGRAVVIGSIVYGAFVGNGVLDLGEHDGIQRCAGIGIQYDCAGQILRVQAQHLAAAVAFRQCAGKHRIAARLQIEGNLALRIGQAAACTQDQDLRTLYRDSRHIGHIDHILGLGIFCCGELHRGSGCFLGQLKGVLLQDVALGNAHRTGVGTLLQIHGDQTGLIGLCGEGLAFSGQPHRHIGQRQIVLIGNGNSIVHLFDGRRILHLTRFEAQNECEGTAGITVGIVGERTDREQHALALLHLHGQGGIAFRLGHGAYALVIMQHGTVDVQALQEEAVPDSRRSGNALNGVGAVLRGGAFIIDALIVARIDLGGEFPQIQRIGIIEGAGHVAQLHRIGLLLSGIIADGKQGRGVVVAGGDHKAHLAGFRLVGLFVTLHIEIAVGAGDLQIHTLCTVNSHINYLTGLHGDLKGGLAAHLHRVFGSTLFALGLQVHNILDHRGLIILGSEELERIRKDLGRINTARMDQADIAVTVDNDGGGIGVYAHHLLPLAVAGHHGEGVAVFLLEGGNVFLCIDGVHGDQGDLVAVLVISLLQIRELRLAGLALDEPEVQDHSLFFRQQLGKGIRCAVRAGNGEIHHQIAQLVADLLHFILIQHACLENDLRPLAGNGIEVLHRIAGRYIRQHCHIRIPGQVGKGHAAVLAGLVIPHQLGHGLILVDVHTHAGQHHTAGGLDLDRIGLRRTYRRIFRRRCITLAAPQEQQCSHAQANYQDRDQNDQ